MLCSVILDNISKILVSCYFVFFIRFAIYFLQLCHWQYILKTAWNRPGLGNKFKTFVYGPGWEPGKPRMGLITDIPDVSMTY